MANPQFLSLFSLNNVTPAIQKNRKNETCDLQAWYYQTENNTLAYAILRGEHGERKDIPVDRYYFICGGTGEFLINDRSISVGPGSIIQIPAHATYNFHTTGNDPLAFYVDVGVKLDLDTIPSK